MSDFSDEDDASSDASSDKEADFANVYGFADDIDVNDLQALTNPQLRHEYGIVERPSYLLQFEAREEEENFLY